MKSKAKNIKELEKKVDNGEEVLGDFKNPIMMEPTKVEVKRSVQRVNVDLSELMLKELDLVAGNIAVSRQAIIKTFLRKALDEFYEKEQLRKSS